MPSEAAPLSSDNKENLAPSLSERLSRSPHPYHGRYHDIKQDELCTPPDGSLIGLGLPGIITSRQSDENDLPAAYFDADHRKRRKTSTSPSDSGTEADDEKGAFLTGLPPPPLRPRKGLKEGYGTSSPLLTPSYLDDAAKKGVFDTEKRRRSIVQSPTLVDSETAKLREKFIRMRRAELIRRVTETLLMGVVGYTATAKAFSRIFARSHGALYPIAGLGGNRLNPALLAYIAILPGLYAFYPLRIIFKNCSRSLSQNKAWYYIHIPAAFDPAALLYPTVIPLIVALSLLRGSTEAVLLNICLGIASVPSKIIPLNDNIPWYSSIQWLLSAAPVLIAEAVLIRSRQLPPPPINNEQFIYSYLLHQALMPVLGHLTTTSLLPAELQLLSVSLINLLFLAISPQAVILKALLWIGGLSVLVSCSKILSWEVALARVPSWRFRRPRDQTAPHRHSRVIKVLDDSVNGRLSSWGLVPTDPENSDSDAPVVQPNFSPRKMKTQLTNMITNQLDIANGNPKTQWKPPVSVTGEGRQWGFPDTNSTIETARVLRTHQRRFTLPSYVGSPPECITQESIQRNKGAKIKDGQAWSFRALTIAQATILSWVFALYVYVVVALIVAFPIRRYIGTHSLGKQEPVGWALGYLFGNNPWFRSIVTNFGFERWVPLPFVAKASTNSKSPAWADCFSQAVGITNVRLIICLYCLYIIAGGLVVVFSLKAVVEVDTRRKVFHGMMVAMFLPTIFVDPTFVSLALMLVLAIFLLLDLFRASQLPPLSKPLTYFLAPYVDGRDHRGPVIVSHIFLLIGCAIPLWLSLAATERRGDPPWIGWDVATRDLSMVAGVVCVGMGDAAASLIGRRFGRRRWPWSGGKSLEGSLAFAAAVVLGLTFARAWLLFGGWDGDSGDTWSTTVGKAAIAGGGASLTEAVLTGGNDNVIVPIILWLFVRGLEM